MRRAKLNKFLLLVVVPIISVISTEHTKSLAVESTTPSRNEKNYFPQMKGCFLLYNIKKKAFDKVIGALVRIGKLYNIQRIVAQCIKNEYKYLKFKCIEHFFSSTKFLGNPYNTTSVAFLTHMVAQQCGFEPGEVIISMGDLHLYKNHIEQAKLQLTRDPRPLPNLVIKRKPDSIFDYKFEDFEIVGYDPYPHIAASIAV